MGNVTEEASATITDPALKAKTELRDLMSWAASTLNLSYQTSYHRSTGEIGPALSESDVTSLISGIFGREFTGRDPHEDFTPADALKFVAAIIRWSAEELDIALPVGE